MSDYASIVSQLKAENIPVHNGRLVSNSPLMSICCSMFVQGSHILPDIGNGKWVRLSVSLSLFGNFCLATVMLTVPYGNAKFN